MYTPSECPMSNVSLPPLLQSCLIRSFKAGVYNCPNCRHSLGKGYSLDPNTQLQGALLQLFPGYEGGRL